MIHHSLRLCLVKPSCIPSFVTVLRQGGLWHEIVRQLEPSYLGADLLQSQSQNNSCFFVVIHFWLSMDAYRKARRSPAHAVLERFLDKLIVVNLDLGAFAWPATQDDCQIPSIQRIPAPKGPLSINSNVHRTQPSRVNRGKL